MSKNTIRTVLPAERAVWARSKQSSDYSDAF